MCPIQQRARRPEQKEERRQAILDAALRLWLEDRIHGEFTMSRLAEQAGVAKGTLYLYFATKEELFLALLEDMFVSWCDAVTRELRSLAGRGDARRVARVLARTLADREPLTRLFPQLASVLELGMNKQKAVEFKQSVCARADQMQEAVARALPDLPTEGGHKVLLHTLALVTGVRQICENEATLRRIMPEHTDLHCRHTVFEQEVEVGVTALIRGFMAGRLPASRRPGRPSAALS
jgi:AcrR family transcriptional regulator